MAIKIDFSQYSKQPKEFNHEEHMEKMEAGIQEALTMLESGEGDRAVPILRNLLGEEQKEEKMEKKI